ncbi:MAG: glycosyltransferase family 4 protein [Planctomycetota bacterium]
MRIVMLAHERLNDRRILQEARALTENNHDVTIVTPYQIYLLNNRANGENTPSAPQSGEPDILHRIHHHLQKTYLYHTKTALLIRSFTKGVFLPFEKYYTRLLRTVFSLPPAHVYHAHDLQTLPIACQVANQHKAHVIYDSHELFTEQEFSWPERSQWERIENAYVRQATRVITINPSVADALRGRYSIPMPAVIMNCIDPPTLSDDGRISKLLPQIGPRKVVLYQGTIAPQRNLEVLIEAARLLNNKNIALVFMGGGPYRYLLEKKVRRFRLGNCVYFIPPVPPSQLVGYASSATIGVIPYLETCLNNRFCTPNKLFEFIAARLPILSHPLPEISRIITQEGIGATCDFTSPGDVATSITRLIDKTISGQLKTALSLAPLKYNWRNEAAKLLEIYSNLPCDE